MEGEELTAAEEFWLALARNDRSGAQAVVDRLDIPLVESAAFSFEEVERQDESGEELVAPPLAVDTGTLSPKNLTSDTPVATVAAWNTEVQVALRLVAETDICGARTADGEVDFLACGAPLDRVGGTSCGWATHETGGMDGKRRSVLKMDLPKHGGKAFVIPVKSSGSAVKRPKVFSRPILPQADLPYEVLTDGWDEALKNLKLRAREWKYFLEAYSGASWLVQLWGGGTKGAIAPEAPPLSNVAPSPQMGPGGYDPQDFEDAPDADSPPSTPPSRSSVQIGQGESIRRRSLFPPPSGTRGEESVPSSRPSLSEDRAGYFERSNERLDSLTSRVRNLEFGANQVDSTLASSFQEVRVELDDVWKEVGVLKLAMPTGPEGGARGTPRFVSRQSQAHPPPSTGLSPAVFQALMRQVVDELQSSGFVTRDELDQTVVPYLQGPNSVTPDQFSGLSRRVALLEKQFADPDGIISKLDTRIKVLEDRRAGDTVERGGKAFRDISSVAAWIQTLADKDVYRYCVDFVTLVMLAADPYETIAQGMANAAAAYKAEFNSLTEARISLSYGLTYPENLMKKHDKEKYAATGGWYWSTTWSSFAAFKGTFNNGAKDSLTSSLAEVSRMIQNAIDYAFPLATQPLPHAIFTEQLLLARGQVTAWVDALEPLYEILSSSGMSPDDAWERVLIFTKAVFDDVRTVRALTLDKNNAAGMIWGSLRTTKLLEEYQRLKFYQHPHISNMLALTSLQREGKKVEKALSTLGGLAKTVDAHQSKLGQLEKDLKALKAAK